MDKVFSTDDHDALLEAAGGKAFQFYERSQRMTKSASEVIPRTLLQEYMPPDTHFGVHLITMGAEEPFGPNRNGDSASIKSLTQHHGTFEKFGCVFREHKNRCPDTQGIGQVKLARYNPAMHRGELIVWVDKDLAPDMYKQARDGQELSWSMSMRLPHDECSCCHKKSARTTDYCNHLKHGMLKWNDEFQKFAYARNEDRVKFFDISEVKRRADRIATYLGYTFSDTDMAKAASAMAGGHVITGADWAQHLNPSTRAPLTIWEESTLEKIANAVEFVKHSDREVLMSLARMTPSTLTDDRIDVLAQPDFRSAAGELAKRAMFLDFPSFAGLITGRPVEELKEDENVKRVIAIKLPNIMGDIMRHGGCDCGEEALEAVAPDEVGCAYSPSKDSIDRLMSEVGDDLGMRPQQAQQRALRITVVKSAHWNQPAAATHLLPVDPFYDAMAEAYAGYIIKSAHIAKDVPGVSENLLYRAIAASLLITKD